MKIKVRKIKYFNFKVGDVVKHPLHNCNYTVIEIYNGDNTKFSRALSNLWDMLGIDLLDKMIFLAEAYNMINAYKDIDNIYFLHGKLDDGNDSTLLALETNLTLI